MPSGAGLLPSFLCSGSQRRQAKRLTEIRPLIRSSDWVLWRGLCFLACRDRGDRDVSRAPNPSAIRHTSAISDQLSVPGTGDAPQHVACQCHSLSLFLSLYDRLPPPQCIWEILTVPCRHKHTHKRA